MAVREDAWWPVALAEDVTSAAPLGVVCAGEAIALFRNSDGAVCAVEDRCPHRRVPLSLGKIISGDIRCPYHGWTFNGATGACAAIPNLRADERVPPRYRLETFPVIEANGFVSVWLGAQAASAPPPTTRYAPKAKEIRGMACVSLAFDEYSAAMLDGPETLLSIAGVGVTDFFLGDPKPQDGALVVDRGAAWTPPGKRTPPFAADYPLIFRTETTLGGGATRVLLLDDVETPLAELLISASPGARGVTNLCWRGFLQPVIGKRAPLRWRAARLFGGPVFDIFTKLDGAAIASLNVAASRWLSRATHETRAAALVAE